MAPSLWVHVVNRGLYHRRFDAGGFLKERGLGNLGDYVMVNNRLNCKERKGHKGLKRKTLRPLRPLR